MEQLAVERRLDALLQHHRPRRKLAPRHYRRLLRLLHHLALFSPALIETHHWTVLQSLTAVAPVRPLVDFRRPSVEDLVRHWCIRTRYPLPRFLFGLLHDRRHSGVAVTALVHLGAGASIRELPRWLAPPGLTRRMAHELWLVQEARCWVDAVRQAQLKNLDAEHLLDAVRQTARLSWDLPDLGWSTRLFCWLRDLGELDHEDQRTLLRFAELERQQGRPERFHLGRRRALFEAEWALSHDRRQQHPHQRFPSSPWVDADVHLLGARWTIRQLKTPLELFIEGRVLSHCVASYTQAAASGRSVIFGLRRDGRRRVTLEISGHSGTLVEALGKANRLPHPEEVRVIQHWATEVGIRLDPMGRVGPPEAPLG